MGGLGDNRHCIELKHYKKLKPTNKAFDELKLKKQDKTVSPMFTITQKRQFHLWKHQQA